MIVQPLEWATDGSLARLGGRNDLALRIMSNFENGGKFHFLVREKDGLGGCTN